MNQYFINHTTYEIVKLLNNSEKDITCALIYSIEIRNNWKIIDRIEFLYENCHERISYYLLIGYRLFE
jgi:hypothetical protein